MKARSLLHIAALCVLLLAAILVLSSVVGAEQAPRYSSRPAQTTPDPEVIELPIEVSIDPAAQTIQIGQTMTIAVKVSHVVDIGAFEVTVAYSPTIVSFVDATIGSLPPSTGRTFTVHGPTVDAVNGTVTFGATSTGDLPKGVSGTGPLAILTLPRCERWSE